jgi:hypothetical protein
MNSQPLSARTLVTVVTFLSAALTFACAAPVEGDTVSSNQTAASTDDCKTIALRVTKAQVYGDDSENSVRLYFADGSTLLGESIHCSESGLGWSRWRGFSGLNRGCEVLLGTKTRKCGFTANGDDRPLITRDEAAR